MKESTKQFVIFFLLVFAGSFLGTLAGSLTSANIQKDRAKYELLDFVEQANKIIRSNR